jgi:hypothetical protein
LDHEAFTSYKQTFGVAMTSSKMKALRTLFAEVMGEFIKDV